MVTQFLLEHNDYTVIARQNWNNKHSLCAVKPSASCNSCFGPA